MTNPAATDIESLVLNGEMSPACVCVVRDRAYQSRDSRKAFREFVEKLSAKENLSARERIGLAVCSAAEGQAEKALELVKNDRSDFGQYVLGRSLLAMGRPLQAREVLRGAAARLRCGETAAAYAEALRRSGDVNGARAVVKDGLDKIGPHPDLYVEAGILSDIDGDYKGAENNYDKALEIDDACVDALFRIAYMADLRGDAETAKNYYERCLEIRPIRMRVLVNVGLLYEEMGLQSDAVKCFDVVAKRFPGDRRARLYLLDALASEHMYFDEEMQKKRERRNKILETPITDFELSVRSRNCLERMNVRTLGDLTRITEIELLAFKNFGETSLTEIKQMMTTKALRLGQALEEGEGQGPRLRPVMKKKPVDQSKALARPVEDLGLSVRAQHCMLSLGVKTIGDLAAKSEVDLMQAKNFGSTSLIEVKRKLSAHGLSLAGSR